MPFLKVVRSPEEDAKGVKPIIVTFEKLTVKGYLNVGTILAVTAVQCGKVNIMQDRTAVLQKSKTLRGSHIVISEDFPRDVMIKRRHLIKFAKQVRHYSIRFYSFV